MKLKSSILLIPYLVILLSSNNVFTQNSTKTNLGKSIVNIDSHEPNTDLSDLLPLKDIIGEAKVVGLGETTHGTHEIFQMKHRMIKFLVKYKKFNIIAFESNKLETDLINQYVLGGKGDPKVLLKGIYFWTWNTQEILDLIEWLRTYNYSTKNKVKFLGIDIQYNNQAISILKEIYKSNTLITKTILKIEELYNVKDKRKIDFENLDILVNKINDNVELNTKSLEDKLKIKECIEVINKVANMDKTQSTVYRDESMANYVIEYQEMSKDNKVIVWAHNMHIQEDEFWKMGSRLDKHFGENYYSISFALSEGFFTAKDYQNKIKRNNPLNDNPKNSIEYRLNQIGTPLFFIETKSLLKDKWFRKKRKFRDIGASLWGSQFTKVRIGENCDGIFYIENSSSSNLLN